MLLEKFFNWVKNLDDKNKMAFFGLVISALVPVLNFIFPVASSHASDQATVNTYGGNSPAIGINHGSVNINYREENPSKAKIYVLRNRSSGATGVLAEPRIETVVDPKSFICTALAGTPIELTGESTNMWRKIRILYGECANKTGWVAVENISFE